jgi:hypothetical protein
LPNALLPDIIGLSTEPTFLAWHENSTWKKHIITEETVNNIDFAARDITGDGYPDLVAAGAITDQIKWYRSTVTRESQRGEKKEYSPDPTL